jgi:WD40 repeat protein
MKYKAFISYSHTHQLQLAAALEAALHRFGVPSHERAGLHFFRDTTNLSASPELWPDIQKALDDSEYFLLVASPEAAVSDWVGKEVGHWRERRGAAGMILVLAAGEIIWSAALGDFDFEKTTALPGTIGKVFSGEPLYVDLRGVNPHQYDLVYPAFCDPIATIAATLHGTPKDTLFGIYASTRIAAEAARLAAEADLALRDGFPERSLLLSSAALRLTEERGEPRLPAAEAILRAGLRRLGGRPLGQIAEDWNAIALRCTPEKRYQRIPTAEEAFKARPWGYTAADLEVPSASFSPDGRLLAIIGADGTARLWTLDLLDWRERDPITLESRTRITKLLFSANSRWLIAASDVLEESDDKAVLRLWDLKRQVAIVYYDFEAAGRSVVMCTSTDEDGTYLAADLEGSGINLWKLPDMEGNDTPVLTKTFARAAEATAVALLTNPLRLLTSGGDGRVHVWNVAGADNRRREPLSIHDAQSGTIQQLTVSSDGKWLAANPALDAVNPTREVTPLLWRLGTETGAISPVRIDVSGNRIWSIHFSPQSLWLLCVADTSFLLGLGVPEPTSALLRLDVTGGTVWNYSFSQDDHFLVTATGLDAYEELALARDPEYTVRLWDYLRQDNAHCKPWRLVGHEDVVTDVAFSPGGSRVITGSLDHTIRCWNCEIARKFQEVLSNARSLGRSSDLESAPGGLAEHMDEHVERSFSSPAVFFAGDDPVLSCIISSNGLWLLTISLGKSRTARLWLLIEEPLPAAPWRLPKLLAPAQLAWFSPTQNWFLFSELAIAAGCKARFSMKRRYLFINGNDNQILLYDLQNEGTQIPDLQTKGSAVTGLGFSPDERWLMATSKNEGSELFEIRLWNLSCADRPTSESSAESNCAFEDVEFSPDSRWLLALQGEKACLRDLTKDDPLSEPLMLPGTNAAFTQFLRRKLRVAFSPCGRWLINAADAHGVAIHDLQGASFLSPAAVLPVTETDVATIGANSSGEFIFAGGTNGFARLWRITGNNELRVFMDLPGHECVEKAVFSADNRWLVTADFQVIQLWDLSARECRCKVKNPGDDIRLGFSIVFLAQDRWLVISKYQSIFLIDLSTAESAGIPTPLPGHQFERIGFWFTPDHRWLVTTDFPFETPRGRGRAPGVRVWDLTSPVPATSSVSLPGLEAGVSRINISPDGRWLTTTSEDGVRLWPLGTSPLLEIADNVVGREFTEEERVRYRISELGVV